jgi:hypothetical protein
MSWYGPAITAIQHNGDRRLWTIVHKWLAVRSLQDRFLCCLSISLESLHAWCCQWSNCACFFTLSSIFTACMNDYSILDRMRTCVWTLITMSSCCRSTRSDDVEASHRAQSCAFMQILFLGLELLTSTNSAPSSNLAQWQRPSLAVQHLSWTSAFCSWSVSAMLAAQLTTVIRP